MLLLAAVLGLAAGTALGVGLGVGFVVRRSRGRPMPAVPLPAPAFDGSTVDLQRLRAALDALPIGVLVADPAGGVILRTGDAVTAIGPFRGDVLIDEAAQALIGDALRGVTGERTLELYGPPRRVIGLRALPIEAGAGGVIVIVEDVTERARIDAVRTDFVANISHELKTPVGALSVLAETLADAEDPADIRRLSDKVVNEAERLARTIDDLLELSRIELGGTLAEGAVAAGPVLRSAIDRISHLAERHGIQIQIEDPGSSCAVLVDRRQLVSALANLVENAVKYSETGGKVELRAERAGDWVEFVVTDHGIGIPERDLDRIFERFYRVDRGRSRQTGGTGLGLSIVRHVATNHGGQVVVASVEGEGSEFRLVVPAASLDAHETVAS